LPTSVRSRLRNFFLSPIQEHMIRMFLWLRVGVGLAGLSLPFILVGCGHYKYAIPFAGSMSAYYHATSNCPQAFDPDHADQPFDCSIPGPPLPREVWKYVYDLQSGTNPPKLRNPQPARGPCGTGSSATCFSLAAPCC
jgi:hypothetical protein